MTARLPELVRRSGYGPDEPIVVGLQRRGEPPIFHARRLTPTTPVYAASLAKQLTAALVATLVRDDVLDVESPLARWLPELPPWAADVRLRHLVHHTANLPADPGIDAAMPGDRTSEGVIRALAGHPALAGTPGGAHAYSNAGYVCLATAAQRAAGRPLPELARRRLFDPLSMTATRYWPGPGPAPPGAEPLSSRHPAPLSLGDGGVWTTAADMLAWSRALDADALGLSALLHTEGRLDDGTPTGYAWGVGVRSHAGRRVYRHGGGWPGLRAMHARLPEPGWSVVLFATADDTERRMGLLSLLLDEVTGAAAGTCP
ncbi:serine hydrolase [Nonomuraea sp. MG754425]|uniref:serine hydrolase domain-containing protein n=1 Tax=Nonomuraea sp. MG754425 TaxID=2570319 RepID=UPI001F1FE35F|nr:serine hydrolase domain-containing protein [Nonomuraea sp. MG754425]